MADLERILQNTPGSVSQQWYEAGAAVDPGTVTIGITAADGTVIQAPGTSTSGSGTAARTYNLTTTHTALLNRWTVTWTSTAKGTLKSYVEIVGGYLFTLAQADAQMDAVSHSVGVPELTQWRTVVEQALEDACGVAFVPRYDRERLSGRSWLTLDLQLKHPKVRAIRDATVNGVALDAAALATIVPAGSRFYYPAGWVGSAAPYDITVGYEHGYDFPPERVTQAALLLLKSWVTQGPVDDRTTTMSNEAGTFTLSTPGKGGIEFGIPEVDAVVDRYDLSISV